METKIKKFDAVAESRKWREATSQKLDAMTPEEQITYLNKVGERVRAEMRAKRKGKSAAAR